ncbi:MAG: Na/Pi symporter [Sediminibacterium sp.]|jgi:phosphate:Na+ symporter|nr:Na/Pi symporter [Sediminibacterium sp.]
MLNIILEVCAGLVLFLYAISSLSKTLIHAIGDKANHWIQKFTSNTLSSILVGAVITTLLDSSSAVIIITIILVNSKLLSFKQAMGIVLGANIGTTVSSQIISLNIGKYSPILLVAGFLLILFSKKEQFQNIGKVILYFGLLFFGLYTIENAVEPLKNELFFADLMKKVENPIAGSIVGAIVTLLIQSSSATVGMAILLTKKGFLSLTGGIAIMLGAELGTCSDTIIATIRGSRAAIKTGLFHVSFNLLSICLGLILFTPFVVLVNKISAGTSIERALANAHMIFNVSGVLLFAWTLPFFEKILNKLIPEKVAS